MPQNSDFKTFSFFFFPHCPQPFSSHDPHKLIIEILQHTQKYIFCPSDKKNRYNLDSFTPNHYFCVGCCHFFIWHLREKKSVPLTKQSRITCFNNSCGTLVEITDLEGRGFAGLRRRVSLWVGVPVPTSFASFTPGPVAVGKWGWAVTPECSVLLGNEGLQEAAGTPPNPKQTPAPSNPLPLLHQRWAHWGLWHGLGVGWGYK